MKQSPIQISEEIKTLNVTSDAFNSRTYIPIKYTCDGENVSPPLTIRGIPDEAKSLVLIVEDIDSPTKIWAHWIVWNIQPALKLKEDSIPGEEGKNDFGTQHYGGPCPPWGTHRYYFKVYALDDLLDLQKEVNKEEVEKAMSSHVIAFGELIGLYKRAM